MSSGLGCERCSNNEEWRINYTQQLETVVADGMSIFETQTKERFENLCKVEAEKHKAEIVIWESRCHDLEDELQKRHERNQDLLFDAQHKNMEFAEEIKKMLEESKESERFLKQKISYLEEKLEQPALQKSQYAAQLDSEIKTYKKNFEAEMYTVKYENEKLKEEIIKISDNSEKNEEVMMQEIDSLTEKLEKAKHDFRVQEVTADRMIRENQQFEEIEVPKLQTEIKKLKKEVKRLNDEWIKSTLALADKKNLPKQTVEEVQKQTIEKCQESMKLQVEQYLKQISDLKNQLDTTEKKFKAQTIAKKYEHDVMEREMKDMESQLEQEKRASDKDLSEHFKRIKELKEEMREQETLLSATRRENETYQNIIHSLQQELQDKEASVNRIKEDFQEQIIFQQSLTSQKHVEIENLNRENAKRLEIIADLKAKLKNTDDVHYVNRKFDKQTPKAEPPSLPDFEMHEERNSEQNDDANDVEMNELIEENVPVKQNLELDDFEKLKKENAENVSIINTLRTQFLVDNHQFEKEIQSHQDEIEQLKSQLEGVDSLKQELRECKTKLQQQTDEMERISKEREQLNEENEMNVRAVLNMQNKLKEAEVNIERLKLDIIELEQPTQQKKADSEKLETLSGTIQDLQTQLKEQEGVIAELREKIALQEELAAQAKVDFEKVKRERAEYYVQTICDLENELRTKDEEHAAALRDLTEKPVRSSRNDLKMLREENENHLKTIQMLQGQLKKNFEASDLAMKELREQMVTQQKLDSQKQMENEEYLQILKVQMKEDEDSASALIRQLQGQLIAAEDSECRRLQDIQQLKQENSLQLETIRALDQKLLEKSVADMAENNSEALKLGYEHLLKVTQNLQEKIITKEANANTTIHELQQQIHAQQNLIVQTAEEMGNLKKENASFTKNILDLQMKLEQSEAADKGDIDDRIVVELREQIQVQQSQISEKDSDNEKLSNQVTHYLDTIHCLQERITNDKTNSEGVIRDLEEKIVNQQKQAEDLERSRNENSRELDNIPSLSDENTEKTEREELERIVEDHREQIGRLMHQLENAGATINQLRQEIEEIQQRFRQEILASQFLNDEHLRQLSEKNAEIEALKNHMGENARLLKSLQTLEKELSELTIADSKRKEQIQMQQAEISRKESEKNQLWSRINQHTNTIENLENSLISIRGEAEATIAQLRCECAQKERRLLSEIKSLADQLVASDKWAGELEEDLNDTIRALEARLKTVITQNSNSTAVLAHTDDKIWALETKLNNSNNDVKRLTNDLVKAKSWVSELKIQHEEQVKMMQDQIQKLGGASMNEEEMVKHELAAEKC
ncbi:hypothetical protein GCK72_006992 [Caenorhabditis remanei]|uniref:Uncharacterized protein n=1 Tax=Caenorhabditis remanei TaxID=31234 RepID=A0A6A5HKB4_CAERE|nr:hypothetical protein GCK72_006992 [Caenorhabditis remanei]KAF1767034.1 hypothetical protein GCK72_006992 [Caenorhabditis remanei]